MIYAAPPRPGYGVWGVLGSTGRWPEVVNIWELDGIDGAVDYFRLEPGDPSMQDPRMAKWWAAAAALRSGASRDDRTEASRGTKGERDGQGSSRATGAGCASGEGGGGDGRGGYRCAPLGRGAMTEPVRLPELGIYLLPGHSERPADLLDEVRAAEALGLGSAWISERFDVKEVGALAGAAAAATERIWIGTGVTNVDTRHPLVLASLATTVSRLSGGRFALGIGRGIAVRSAMLGLAQVSNRKLADFAGLMRRLWSGEHVAGHDGALGRFPYLHQASWLHESIPLLMAAFGEKSLEFAGGVFDGVILHTFLSDEAVARAVALVRRGAEKAGRDPSSVRVWCVLAVACDAPEERQLKLLTARMATYLQAPGYGELLVAINRWDPAVLARFRASEVVRSIPGAIDALATPEQLRQIRELIPAQWLPAAAGSPAQGARRIEDQFAAGADGVILHASLPHEAAPAIEAYAKQRPAPRGADPPGRPA